MNCVGTCKSVPFLLRKCITFVTHYVIRIVTQIVYKLFDILYTEKSTACTQFVLLRVYILYTKVYTACIRRLDKIRLDKIRLV